MEEDPSRANLRAEPRGGLAGPNHVFWQRNSWNVMGPLATRGGIIFWVVLSGTSSRALWTLLVLSAQ